MAKKGINPAEILAEESEKTLDDHEIARQAALRSAPQALKRQAPKIKRGRRKKYSTPEEREAAWGVSVTYRIKPDTRDAVEAAIEQHDIQKGDFVDFLLRASLTLLAQDRIELPVDGDSGGPKKLRLPAIPDEYA